MHEKSTQPRTKITRRQRTQEPDRTGSDKKQALLRGELREAPPLAGELMAANGHRKSSHFLH